MFNGSYAFDLGLLYAIFYKGLRNSLYMPGQFCVLHLKHTAFLLFHLLLSSFIFVAVSTLP